MRPGSGCGAVGPRAPVAGLGPERSQHRAGETTRKGRHLGVNLQQRVLTAGLVALALVCCRDSVGPDTIAFTVQPAGGVTGEQIMPPVEVSVRNAFGDPLSGTVTLTLDPNPCGWVLGGRRAVDLNGGTARFDDLSLDKIGRGYTLRASSGPLTVMSRPFNVASPITNQPLIHDNLLCTKPNNQTDAESLTWVPEDDAFWVANDNRVGIYEVDRRTGKTLSSIGLNEFIAALPDANICDDGDGNPATTCSYVNEFEQVAYDPIAKILYVVNTVNTSTDRPAIFRLAKDACAGCFTIQDWQPLPVGPGYGSLGTADGNIIIAHRNRLYGYDYATNRVATVDASGDSLPPLYATPTDIVALGYDGSAMWILTQRRLLHKVLWSTKALLALYDLGPFSISTPKGLETIRDTIYVLEGDVPNPINIFTIR